MEELLGFVERFVLILILCYTYTVPVMRFCFLPLMGGNVTLGMRLCSELANQI